MDMDKSDLVACLDKIMVACFGKGTVVCLDEGVITCSDKNNNDDFGVNFLLSYPLEYLLVGTLGGKCIFHHGFMKKMAVLRPMYNFPITMNRKIKNLPRSPKLWEGKGLL